MASDPTDRPKRSLKARVLLAAAAGVATAQLTACGPQPVGNLMALPRDVVDDQADATTPPDVMEEQPVGNLDVSVPPPDVADSGTGTDDGSGGDTGAGPDGG